MKNVTALYQPKSSLRGFAIRENLTAQKSLPSKGQARLKYTF